MEFANEPAMVYQAIAGVLNVYGKPNLKHTFQSMKKAYPVADLRPIFATD
jgi:hypothetical protein